MPEAEPKAQAEALHQRIAVRAYALWEQEGCPHGCDIAHWLKAEAELAAAWNEPKDAAAPAASGGKKPEKVAA
jgi:hypothetical protein